MQVDLLPFTFDNALANLGGSLALFVHGVGVVHLFKANRTLSAVGTLKFLSTGGADLTGVMPVGTTPTVFSGSVYAPAFETTTGVGLDIASATGSAHGHLTYQEIS